MSASEPAIRADDLSVHRYLSETDGEHRPAYA